MRNCWRGTANVECCPTCRTGHLLLSVVREVLLLFSSWGESSCRMFTSSAVTQIKTDPLLVKGEFSGALPNIVPAIRWLFEILEGNNSRRLFYNIWSVQVPVILLYVHAGSAGKSKTVQSLPVDTSVLSPKYVLQRTREAIEIIPKLNVNTIKWVWDDVQYWRQCESMKLRKMNH